MPLIDEDTLATDRRPGTQWAWLAVAAVVILLWILLAFGVSFSTRPQAAPQVAVRPPIALPASSNPALQQAYAAFLTGDPQTALQALAGAGKPAALSAPDRHFYYRIGAESHAALGQHATAADLFEEYLSMGPQIYGNTCRGCHGAGQYPTQVAAMRNSPLAFQYVGELRAAGRLSKRLIELRAQAAKSPNDPRLSLLLYHLETAYGKNAAATRHGVKLLQYDQSVTLASLVAAKRRQSSRPVATPR